MLSGKPQPEYVGKMLFDENSNFLGIITQAVESEATQEIYCQYVYNDGEYGYIYLTSCCHEHSAHAQN